VALFGDRVISSPAYGINLIKLSDIVADIKNYMGLSQVDMGSGRNYDETHMDKDKIDYEAVILPFGIDSCY
jgi:hypothetical protein